MGASNLSSRSLKAALTSATIPSGLSPEERKLYLLKKYNPRGVWRIAALQFEIIQSYQRELKVKDNIILQLQRQLKKVLDEKFAKLRDNKESAKNTSPILSSTPLPTSETIPGHGYLSSEGSSSISPSPPKRKLQSVSSMTVGRSFPTSPLNRVTVRHRPLKRKNRTSISGFTPVSTSSSSDESDEESFHYIDPFKRMGSTSSKDSSKSNTEIDFLNGTTSPECQTPPRGLTPTRLHTPPQTPITKISTPSHSPKLSAFVQLDRNLVDDDDIDIPTGSLGTNGDTTFHDFDSNYSVSDENSAKTNFIPPTRPLDRIGPHNLVEKHFVKKLLQRRKSESVVSSVRRPGKLFVKRKKIFRHSDGSIPKPYPRSSNDGSAIPGIRKKRYKILQRRRKPSSEGEYDEPSIWNSPLILNEEEECLTTKVHYNTMERSEELMEKAFKLMNALPEVEGETPIVDNPLVVEVPSWRESILTKTHFSSGTEDLNDSVFLKRHQKLELDERRRKRWDAQRLREEQYLTQLKNRARRRDQYNARRKRRLALAMEDSEDFDDDCFQDLETFQPKLNSATCIRVADDIPISAFGYPIPIIRPAKFELPWEVTPRRPKRSRNEVYYSSVFANRQIPSSSCTS